MQAQRLAFSCELCQLTLRQTQHCLDMNYFNAIVTLRDKQIFLEYKGEHFTHICRKNQEVLRS